MSDSMKRHKLLSLSFAVFAAISFADTAGATPASIDLGNSSSISTSLPAAPVIAFDVGVNTVSGYADYYAYGFSLIANPIGAFAFEIPSGMHLTSAGFTFDLHPDPGTNIAKLGFQLHDGNSFSAPIISSTTVDLINGSSFASLFSDRVPLSEGVYGIENNLIGVNNGGGWYATYQFQFDVEQGPAAPVPEPATVALMLFGGAALAGYRRLIGSR